MSAVPKKVLVVDDTPLNVKMLADLLTFKGYQTVTAASGAEALTKIEAEHPDLVLLDVMMPGMNGYEVCQKIRANPATGMLPVVMVTALDPGQERVKGIEAGADDFLSKPINQPELLARVRSLLRIKELWDTVQSQATQLAEWNKNLEQRVQEQVAAARPTGPAQEFLFAPARRIHRQRRRRRLAEDAPPRSGGRIFGHARLHRLHRQLRARRGHERAR